MAEENSIERIIETGLVDPAFDLVTDYSELTLDAFLDNETIREIPVVKTIVGVVKGALAIREIFLAKKLIVFLQQYHSGSLSEARKEAFVKIFNEDKAYRDSVVQQLVIMTDRYINIEKCKVLSNLFQAHVNDKLAWSDFCYLSEYLDGLHTRAFSILSESATSENPWYFTTEGGKDGGGILIGAGFAIIQGNHYSINIWGRVMYHYGIKGDIDYTFPADGISV